jgi:hypothetical protein
MRRRFAGLAEQAALAAPNNEPFPVGHVSVQGQYAIARLNMVGVPRPYDPRGLDQRTILKAGLSAF